MDVAGVVMTSTAAMEGFDVRTDWSDWRLEEED